MHRNKNDGFSMIEITLVLGIVSVLLAICAPHITKAMRGINSPECSGGYRTVRKVFVNDAKFTIPSDASDEIKFIIIGAGGGGANGSIELDSSGNVLRKIVNSAECSLSQLDDTSKFYTNVYFSAIKTGSSASCSASNSVSGSSGDFVRDVSISAEKNKSYSYNFSSNSTENFSISWANGMSGITGNSGSPLFLQGGVPGVYIMNNNKIAGTGEDCEWGVASDGSSLYKAVSDTRGSSACKMIYKLANAGAGGGGGAYASFTLSDLNGKPCTIVIGDGGTSGQDGESTSVTCNNITYSASGGGGATNSSAGAGGSTFTSINSSDAVKINGRAGSSPDATTISGGKGGDVCSKLKDGSCETIYSTGGLGGCYASNTSLDCSNSNGADGVSPSSDLRHAGSGGGGGSCSEDGCGRGGFGANGVVVIEYRAKCY